MDLREAVDSRRSGRVGGTFPCCDPPPLTGSQQLAALRVAEVKRKRLSSCCIACRQFVRLSAGDAESNISATTCRVEDS